MRSLSLRSAHVGTVVLLGAFVAQSEPAAAEKRFFTIAAVEPKGGTTVDKEPFPTAALPEGGGYVIKKPDQTGRWEVSAYVWQPSQIIVTQGDEVTLEFVGINGAEHPTTIVGYDKTLVLKRGHVHQDRAQGRQGRHLPDRLQPPQTVDGRRADRDAEEVAGRLAPLRYGLQDRRVVVDRAVHA